MTVDEVIKALERAGINKWILRPEDDGHLFVRWSDLEDGNRAAVKAVIKASQPEVADKGLIWGWKPWA